MYKISIRYEDLILISILLHKLSFPPATEIIIQYSIMFINNNEKCDI